MLQILLTKLFLSKSITDAPLKIQIYLQYTATLMVYTKKTIISITWTCSFCCCCCCCCCYYYFLFEGKSELWVKHQWNWNQLLPQDFRLKKPFPTFQKTVANGWSLHHIASLTRHHFKFPWPFSDNHSAAVGSVAITCPFTRLLKLL